MFLLRRNKRKVARPVIVMVKRRLSLLRVMPVGNALLVVRSQLRRGV